MCGLAGYIGKPLEDDTFLHKLLLQLKNRGRDGFGFLGYRPKKEKPILLYKRSDEVSKKFLRSAPSLVGSTAVMMHTRQATSGTQEPKDCHPLTHKGISIVHNGVITAHQVTRRQLEIPDDKAWPEVDSFLIAWIIGEAPNIADGIKKVFETLMGSLTFLVFSPRAPSTMWAASNVGVSLNQFKHKGQDYFCSTQQIFEDALTTREDKKMSKGGYRAFGPLTGVWEASPRTLHQLITEKDLHKVAPRSTVVYSTYNWRARSKQRYGKYGRRYTKADDGRYTGGDYLPPGREQGHIGLWNRETAGDSNFPARFSGVGAGHASKKGETSLTPYVRSLESVAQKFPQLSRRRLLRDVMQEVKWEGLSLLKMPQIIRAIDSKLIEVLTESSDRDCEFQCGYKAKVRLHEGEEDFDFCWTCLAVYCEWIKEEDRPSKYHHPKVSETSPATSTALAAKTVEINSDLEESFGKDWEKKEGVWVRKMTDFTSSGETTRLEKTH